MRKTGSCPTAPAPMSVVSRPGRQDGSADATTLMATRYPAQPACALPSQERPGRRQLVLGHRQAGRRIVHAVLGRQHQFRSPDQFRRHSGNNRHTRSALGLELFQQLAVNLTSDNRYLLESWWFSDRRGRDEFRYANWSGWSHQGTDCHFNSTIGEPNDCCGGDTTIGEDVLQMTGLPSGARLWNDLHNTTVGDYQPGRWYAIQGYFSEWDTSQLASDVILARGDNLAERCPA